MAGPYTPTLLALLTRSGMLKLNTTGFSQFSGKVACITGAASGIGSSLATRASSEGCRAVVLADICWPSSSKELRQKYPFVKQIEDSGTEVLTIDVDVGKQDEILKMRDACLDGFGGCDLLFQNAGVGMPGVLSATDEAFERAININLNSVLWGIRSFVPMMEQSDAPCRIVNTASLAGISEATGLYGLTKHAVVAATEAVASELAWRKSNVEVCVLCPSYVSTNVVNSTAAAQLSAEPGPNPPDASTQEQIHKVLEGLPLLISGGMHPDDVASKVFEGLAAGSRYIYTEEAHTLAAIEDRVEQLRAGGIPEGFSRRMESVIDQEIARCSKL